MRRTQTHPLLTLVVRSCRIEDVGLGAWRAPTQQPGPGGGELKTSTDALRRKYDAIVRPRRSRVIQPAESGNR